MMFQSLYPEVAIPDVALSSLILQKIKQFGDKPALIDGPTGRILTYKQLERLIHQAAAGLVQRGFKKGDVLAIYSPNIPEYVVLFHAVSLVGGINTLIDPSSTASDLARQLKDTQAKYLATIPSYKAEATEAAEMVEEIFVFGESSYTDLLETEGQPPQVEINPREDLAALPFSSGTTGYSRGVMLTQRNLVASTLQIEAADLFDEDDIVMAVLSFYQVYGLEVLLNYALYIGATLVTMPQFELSSFLHGVQDYKVSFAPLVPPMIRTLAKHPLVDEYNLSSLEMILSIAAPLDKRTARLCTRRLDCLVAQSYGLTETSAITHVSPTNNTIQINPSSIGPCVSNTECKIVNTQTGASVGPNRKGELWIRGPQVMKGYLNEDDNSGALDEQGWFHTGDLAYVDSQGYFYIAGRVKDLISCRGYQVVPAELEAIILTHPSIRDVAVVSSYDERAGEIPKAFVVFEEVLRPEEIMAFVAERVAPHKRIRQVEVVNQIPKSASGKILRRMLIEQERKEIMSH